MATVDSRRGLSTGDWVQIVSALSILVGIAVVVFEIRQTRAVAEAQLITDQTGILSSFQISVMGEDGARILAKACDEPGDLTRAETEVLTARYRTMLQTLILRKRIPVETGLLEGDTWRASARGLAGGILGTPYGRYWWKGERDYWVAGAHPEIANILDKVLKETGNGCVWKGKHKEYMETIGNANDA